MTTVASCVSVFLFLFAIIVTHRTEIIEAGHGPLSCLFFGLFVVGWLLVAVINGSNYEELDIVPIIISLFVGILSFFSSGCQPIPYIVWSVHTFFFWLIQAIISWGVVYYAFFSKRHSESWGVSLF
jgi:hypothetical protein